MFLLKQYQQQQHQHESMKGDKKCEKNLLVENTFPLLFCFVVFSFGKKLFFVFVPLHSLTHSAHQQASCTFPFNHKKKGRMKGEND